MDSTSAVGELLIADMMVNYLVMSEASLQSQQPPGAAASRRVLPPLQQQPDNRLVAQTGSSNESFTVLAVGSSLADMSWDFRRASLSTRLLVQRMARMSASSGPCTDRRRSAMLSAELSMLRRHFTQTAKQDQARPLGAPSDAAGWGQELAPMRIRDKSGG